jgi:ethanolamine utilization protein EutA
MSLYLTDPIAGMGTINSMVFSGGVAEFVYRREQRDFGDLGKRLGHALRRRIDAGEFPWVLLPDSQGIRATALGASEYSAQLSGNTGYISDPDRLLPRRNLQVLHAEFDFAGDFNPVDLGQAILTQMQSFDLIGTEADLVLALHWRGPPDFQRVRGLAEGIRLGLAERITRDKPIYIILDADIAMNLGSVLREDFAINNDVMVVDGIALWNFDYIDLGRIRQPSNTVPVMIKSLVFKDVTSGPRRHELVHHQPDLNKGEK